jgi:LPXTG-motif cell wall-anchored protein
MALFGSLRRQRTAAAAAVGLVASAGVFALTAGPAGAGTIGVCSGDTQLYANLDIELSQVGDSGEVVVVDLSGPLAAGNYSVNTIAFDGYLGRTEDREREAYYIEFIDAAGTVVGRTGETPELPDDQEIVEAAITFEVTLSGTATQMRLVQIIDFVAPGDEVEVGCVGITRLADPTTTTQAPTTTATPTTAAPTTQAPTTAAPTTATTARAASASTAAPVVRSTSAQLPVTGGETVPLAIAGGVLMGAGALLVVRARRTA